MALRVVVLALIGRGVLNAADLAEDFGKYRDFLATKGHAGCADVLDQMTAAMLKLADAKAAADADIFRAPKGLQ